ncbi:MAG: hypothetical protein AB8G23_05715 [Myxococcota bacterium]
MRRGPKQKESLEAEVARRLREAGAKPKYVRRLTAELRDHLLEAAPCSDDMSQLNHPMGSADSIVEAALSDPRVLQWARRVPWLVFGLLPPIATILIFTLVALGIVGGVESAESYFTADLSSSDFSILHKALDLVCRGTSFAMPAALALSFSLLAHRARAAYHWPVLSTALLALFSTTILLIFEAPIDSGEGSLTLEIGTEGAFSRLGRVIPPTVVVLLATAFRHIRPIRLIRLIRLIRPSDETESGIPSPSNTGPPNE